MGYLIPPPIPKDRWDDPDIGMTVLEGKNIPSKNERLRIKKEKEQKKNQGVWRRFIKWIKANSWGG